MPDSITSEESGDSAKVIGSSIASVALGPMPGSTPMSVPISAPIKQYSRLSSVRTAPKPKARWLRRSASISALRHRQPGSDDRHRQSQCPCENEDTEGGDDGREQDGEP